MTAKAREGAFDAAAQDRLTKVIVEHLAGVSATDGAPPSAHAIIEEVVNRIQEELTRIGSPARVAIERDMDDEPVGFILFDGIDKTIVHRLTASGPLIRYQNTPIYVATEIGPQLFLKALAGDVRSCAGAKFI